MHMELSELSAEELQRYQQQMQLCEVGITGQKRLKAAKVIVIGAGGLGCQVLHHLAAAGIGALGIVDDDVVSLSNLQRQLLYTVDDIGQKKCHRAKAVLCRLNPHLHCICYDAKLTAENSRELIRPYEVVIDATDNSAGRYVLNDACVMEQKPFIYGAIEQFGGQVALFNARISSNQRSPDYRYLYPSASQAALNCSQAGVLSPLPGIIGSLQALEALKLILEIEPTLAGQLLKIDTHHWTLRLYRLQPAPPVENQDDLEITYEQLQHMAYSREDLLLIDIREQPAEPIQSPIPYLHVPFSAIALDYHQLPLDKSLILFCQRGVSSLQLAKQIKARDKNKKVFSLKGGVKALLQAGYEAL